MGYLDEDELKDLTLHGFFGHLQGSECPDCGHNTLIRRKSRLAPKSEYIVECKNPDCSYHEEFKY